jgi:hypothetical protein
VDPTPQARLRGAGGIGAAREATAARDAAATAGEGEASEWGRIAGVGEERITCCPARAGGLGATREAATAGDGAATVGEAEASEWGYTTGVGRAVGEERTTCCPTRACRAARSHGPALANKNGENEKKCIFV